MMILLGLVGEAREVITVATTQAQAPGLFQLVWNGDSDYETHHTDWDAHTSVSNSLYPPPLGAH